MVGMCTEDFQTGCQAKWKGGSPLATLESLRRFTNRPASVNTLFKKNFIYVILEPL